ncbi:MAG: DUF4832 domain-containing protein [Opitutales bacterium]|nr:DUF4832 domain-containing protein [Opitutales bacterium]
MNSSKPGFHEISSENAVSTVRPDPAVGWVRNPLKGIRDLYKPGYPSFPGNLTKIYLPWNELEGRSDDGIDRVCETTGRIINEAAGDGRKQFIPRVFTSWPRSEPRYFQEGSYWPADLPHDDLSSPRFLNRCVRFIEKLGRAWDNDPRIAFVEIGLIGHWGEHHRPWIPADAQAVIGRAFTDAFTRTKVMQRYPEDFAGCRFGVHWDSFAHPGEQKHRDTLLSEPWIDRWKDQVIGGEMAYNWGKMFAETPLDGVRNHHRHLLGEILRLHVNHLDFWVREEDLSDPEIERRACELHNALGYHFIVEEVKFTGKLRPGRKVAVDIAVRNTGSSPLYYRWPLEIALLAEDNAVPLRVWQASSVDVRDWLPNTGGPHCDRVVLNLPAGLPRGKYAIGLSLLDPATGRPGARFANECVDTAGRLRVHFPLQHP